MCDYTVIINIKTSDGRHNSFPAWNTSAIEQLGLTESALSPSEWAFHVYGDLYQVPNMA